MEIPDADWFFAQHGDMATYRLTRRGEIVRDVLQGLIAMACMVAVVVAGVGVLCAWFGVI